ncbi:hypothetical protein UFOVP326_107 [uncultured Caudovirales phage]|uniref:Uncharacterized protein n=1 Tax=uncultured Caudovirales phage TaxID=2100421 RepID=A0A6J5LYP7_9CAUD|nr:hypothetical protein UFOVP326_107 [uncultured Caudovirales phage]
MNAWILVVVFSAANGGYSNSTSTVSMQRFDSQPACSWALDWVRKNAPGFRTATCLPAGDNPWGAKP